MPVEPTILFILPLLEIHPPKITLQLCQHRQGEQVGPHLEWKFALQVAELEGDLDIGLPEERFGFPGSLPRPVS